MIQGSISLGHPMTFILLDVIYTDWFLLVLAPLRAINRLNSTWTITCHLHSQPVNNPSIIHVITTSTTLHNKQFIQSHSTNKNLWKCIRRPCSALTSTYLVPVVRRLDNAIHRINRYPVDKCSQDKPCYLLDSDSSSGLVLSTFWTTRAWTTCKLLTYPPDSPSN